MKNLFLLLLICFIMISCSATRNYNENKGLMLLENTQLGRNKAYYSKHNTKNRKAAIKKYKKYNSYKHK